MCQPGYICHLLWDQLFMQGSGYLIQIISPLLEFTNKFSMPSLTVWITWLTFTVESSSGAIKNVKSLKWVSLNSCTVLYSVYQFFSGISMCIVPWSTDDIMLLSHQLQHVTTSCLPQADNLNFVHSLMLCGLEEKVNFLTWSFGENAAFGPGGGGGYLRVAFCTPATFYH